MFLYRRLLNDKKPLLSESFSLAGCDGQQRAHPRAEFINIVFINPGRCVYIYIYNSVTGYHARAVWLKVIYHTLCKLATRSLFLKFAY